MKRKGAVAAATGTGVVGYAVGRLTSADIKHLLERVLDLLKEQGPYAFYALMLSGLFIWFFIFEQRKLLQSKQDEIDRVSKERDKFQKLFIDDWRSTKSGGGDTSNLKGERRK